MPIVLTASEVRALAGALPWFAAFGAPLPSVVAAIDAPQDGALHFVDGARARRPIVLPHGACLLAPPDTKAEGGARVVSVARPRGDFAVLTRTLRALRNAPFTGMSAPGRGVEPGAWVAEDVQVGTDCEIMAGAVVRSYVVLGECVRIHPGACIGVDGYGYGWNEADDAIQIAHLGGVRIADGVDVGPASVVCSGTIEPTVIGAGTKLDGHVYVGHNAKVGARAMICAGVIVGGSAVVEDSVWIHPGAKIKTKIRIGARAVIGMGAVVMRDVEPDETVMGDTAREVRSRLRRDAALDAILRDRDGRG